MIGSDGNRFIAQYLEDHHIGDVHGDVLEIGTFTGATTRALAQWAQKHGKRVVTVDPFSPSTDAERSSLYYGHLRNRSQYQLFLENVEDLPVDVCMQTSQEFFRRHSLIKDKFCAILIDGAHDYSSVYMDLVWSVTYLSENGVVLAHDYQHNIPSVTSAIDTYLAVEWLNCKKECLPHALVALHD